jgi:hypothetical protein
MPKTTSIHSENILFRQTPAPPSWPMMWPFLPRRPDFDRLRFISHHSSLTACQLQIFPGATILLNAKIINAFGHYYLPCQE